MMIVTVARAVGKRGGSIAGAGRSRERMRGLAVCVLIGLAACEPPAELPAALLGSYVPHRSSPHDPDAVALEVGPRILAADSLQIEVVAGEPEASAGYRVARARVKRWAGNEMSERTCEGSLRRERETLTIELVEPGDGSPCLEPAARLWRARRRVQTLPDALLGVYGERAGFGEGPVRVLGDRLEFLAEGVTVELETLDWFPQESWLVVVRSARVGGHRCRGHLGLDGDRLVVMLGPTPDSPPDATCPSRIADRWRVDPSLLPRTPLVREGRWLAMERDRLVIAVDGAYALRCEQEVLGTTREAMGHGKVRTRIALAPARPVSGADECAREIAATLVDGASASSAEPECPRALALIRDVSGQIDVVAASRGTCFSLDGVYAPAHPTPVAAELAAAPRE